METILFDRPESVTESVTRRESLKDATARRLSALVDWEVVDADGGRWVSNLLPEGEWELEQEDESLARLGARFTVRLNLGNHHGFRTSTPFLDDWIKRSAAGQIGTTVNFRRRFCAANHFEVDVPIKGRTRTVHVAEIWGLPMVYFSGNGPKPLLSRIMPRGWHLSQVGRSVGPPRFCRLKP